MNSLEGGKAQLGERSGRAEGVAYGFRGVGGEKEREGEGARGKAPWRVYDDPTDEAEAAAAATLAACLDAARAASAYMYCCICCCCGREFVGDGEGGGGRGREGASGGRDSLGLHIPPAPQKDRTSKGKGETKEEEGTDLREGGGHHANPLSGARAGAPPPLNGRPHSPTSVRRSPDPKLRPGRGRSSVTPPPGAGPATNPASAVRVRGRATAAAQGGAGCHGGSRGAAARATSASASERGDGGGERGVSGTHAEVV